MSCCLVLIALAAPRLAIVLLVVFSDHIGTAFEGGVALPFLGFLFLPMTTLAYTLAQHRGGVDGLYVVLVVLAVLWDVGALGGAGHDRHRSRRRSEK